MFCPNCGSSVKDQAKFCENCGAPVTVPVSVPQPASVPQPTSVPQPVSEPQILPEQRSNPAAPVQPYSPQYAPVQQPQTQKGKSVTLLIVFSAIALAFCWLSIFNLPLIAAMVFLFVSIKKKALFKKKFTTGLILFLVAAAATIAFTVFYLANPASETPSPSESYSDGAYSDAEKSDEVTLSRDGAINYAKAFFENNGQLIKDAGDIDADESLKLLTYGNCDAKLHGNEYTVTIRATVETYDEYGMLDDLCSVEAEITVPGNCSSYFQCSSSAGRYYVHDD